MKIPNLKLPKVTLGDAKIIGAICLMVLAIVLSFGIIGKGCGGGGEEGTKAASGQGLENVTANEAQANNNVGIRVKMAVKAGAKYSLQISATNKQNGNTESADAISLDSENDTGEADFSLALGAYTIKAELSDESGEALGDASKDINVESTEEDALEVELEITVAGDENDEIEITFTQKVNTIVSINNPPNIKDFKNSASVDKENGELDLAVSFSLVDLEDADLCASSDAVSIVLACDIGGEDKTIENALFEADDEANNCAGTLNIPKDLDYGGEATSLGIPQDAKLLSQQQIQTLLNQKFRALLVQMHLLKIFLLRMVVKVKAKVNYSFFDQYKTEGLTLHEPFGIKFE